MGYNWNGSSRYFTYQLYVILGDCLDNIKLNNNLDNVFSEFNDNDIEKNAIHINNIDFEKQRLTIGLNTIDSVAYFFGIDFQIIQNELMHINTGEKFINSSYRYPESNKSLSKGKHEFIHELSTYYNKKYISSICIIGSYAYNIYGELIDFKQSCFELQ